MTERKQAVTYKITLGIAILNLGSLIAAGTILWNAAAWKTSVDNQIDIVNARVDVTNARIDASDMAYWTRAQQQRFVNVSEQRNTGMDLPDTWEIPKQ